MSFHLYSSNRLAALVEALGEVTGAAPLPPFAPEVVVVQSGGMARWLSYQLAEAQEVCANLDCPFPNDFVGRVFRLVLPELVSRPMVDRLVLQWQLLRILPELVGRPEFSMIAGYLGDGGELKRYQLAGRLADRFDQYLIFRPEMVLAWEAGQEQHWQARLWRELISRPDCLAGAVHRAHLREQLLATLSDAGFVDPGLPVRVAVFGLSSLPPFHLQIFNALAQHIDLHFFLFSPSREYWGDIRSEKAIGQLTAELTPEELHLTEGNSLLASLGQQGQELFRMLQDCQLASEHDLFVDPLTADPPGRLALLQADILDLHEGGEAGGSEGLVDPDHSLQIHACASPRRELEVLHDRLLALFEELPDLAPRDILVMTPDIELYSPLLPTVFGAAGEAEKVRIPFSVADRKVRNEGEMVGAFLSLLELRGSRLELARVLAVLEKTPVRNRFKLTAEDLELIEGWLLDVNIRWGIDEIHRAELGLPATRENSWRFGLDRLLLGYAMDDRDGATFADILPYGGMEGNESEVLGSFLDFTETLFARVRQLQEARTLTAWGELLLAMLGELLEPPEGEQDLEWRFLQGALGGLARLQETSGYREIVGFPVVVAHLEAICESETLTGGFLAGRVTFCELLPMRAVPFRVVCLLGMNDGDYPRSAPLPSFDLIGAAPRPGDRSRRKDDRYLFLEALLSAREVFYLSYLGQSVRDGGSLLPSVLISELVEYLEKRLPGRPVPLIAHPLQPFSPEYFGERAELFSFSEGNLRAARALVGPKSSVILAAELLPEPPDSFRQVGLAELVDFFKNPTRFFCRRRLGIQLERECGELPDSENFGLAGLDRFQLGSGILENLISGRGVAADYLVEARRCGVLPHGSVGRAAFARVLADVEAVAAKLPPMVADQERSGRDGELHLGDFLLSGLVGLRGDLGQLLYRFGKVRAVDLIDGWLHHLFLQALPPGVSPAETKLVGTDQVYSFAPVADPQGILTGLLALYWQGLRQPLPFFPETSKAYQERLGRGAAHPEALARALVKWEGGEFGVGEGEEAYRQLCYRGQSPLVGAFAEIAEEFWAVLRENCHG